ncbi:integrating conjugative element protein (plasmid) [Rhizobium sp. ACO-34A]|nr:TIGR03757 family integrating conjugative element protein [Rhizobium sp. ACO-34A]ATN36791.1 integrating conjugative element protein [Rhizobium sp. ACO-34A]
MPHSLLSIFLTKGFPIASTSILLGTVAFENVSAAEIKVFTTRSISISAPADVTVAYLDDASAIEERLSANLPANQNSAETIARQRLQEGGAGLQQEIAAAYQGVADAWSLGIATLPAVVVDRRYVVYGEADIAKAVARIEEYRREQK